MLAGAFVRGAFQRIEGLGTAGRSLIRRAPKQILKLGLGTMLENPRLNTSTASWLGPSFSAIRNMMSGNSYSSFLHTPLRNTVGLPFITYTKRAGMAADHLAASGIGLALSKGRHTNLL